MTKALDAAQAAYNKARDEYRAYWLRGDTVAMAAAESRMNAAWTELCRVTRETPFQWEEGSGAAYRQHSRFALDDA